MKTADWGYPVIEYRGNEWRLEPPQRTSDGYLLSWGWLLDESGDSTEEGHSFFLGRAE